MVVSLADILTDSCKASDNGRSVAFAKRGRFYYLLWMMKLKGEAVPSYGATYRKVTAFVGF